MTTEEEMVLNKESDMFNSLKLQTPKVHKVERKEQAILKSTWRNPHYYRNKKIPLNNKPECKRF
jgi:hypothetical protein